MTEPTSPDVTELIERLNKAKALISIVVQPSYGTPFSDLFSQAADALLASRQEIERLTKISEQAFEQVEAVNLDFNEEHARAEAAEAALRLSAQGREDVVEAVETLRFSALHLVAEEDKADALATLEMARNVMREVAEKLDASR